MKRTPWVKQTGACLVVVVMLAGMAWADPSGSANVSQVLNGATFRGPGGDEQKVFRTTDSITIEATLYDDFPGCAGVAPTFVQLYVFNLEGELINEFTASSGPFAPGSKYRLLFLDLAAGALPVGSYKVAILIRSCDNAVSWVPDFLTIRVVAP